MSNITTYQRNPNLKSAGVQIQYTEEQIKEYIKCSTDPIYFIENYAKIVSLDEGIVPFILYDYQKRLLNTIHESREVISRQFRQGGKCMIYKEFLKIRNKKTGEILTITIGELYERLKNSSKEMSIL